LALRVGFWESVVDRALFFFIRGAISEKKNRIGWEDCESLLHGGFLWASLLNLGLVYSHGGGVCLGERIQREKKGRGVIPFFLFLFLPSLFQT